MKFFEGTCGETSLRPSEMILEIGKTRDALLRVLCLDADNALKTAVKFVSEYYGFDLELDNTTPDLSDGVLVKIEPSDDEDFPYRVTIYVGGKKKVLEYFETREDALAYTEHRLNVARYFGKKTPTKPTSPPCAGKSPKEIMNV